MRRDMDLCCSSYMKELSLNSNYNNKATSFDHLPDGLVVDILSRLPVKTLVQSTCVSKLWYSTIKSPSFISAHLSRSISDPSCYYLFLSHYHSPSVTVISDNPLVTCHQDFNFPFETQSTYIELIGACNGLICVTDSYPTRRGRDIYLTNPFIHKYKRLGAESSCYADLIRKTVSDDDVNIGFGDSEIEMCLLVLEKKSGGQIKWEEFNYECANFNPSHCIGFGAMGLCGGRLIFVANSDLLPEYIVAVDLDNSCAIERLALDFTDVLINEAANVSESLVLLSD